MLTLNYLRRSLSKWKYPLLITVIISAIGAAVSFEINRWLPNYALSFSNLIAQEFHTQISFKKVHYGFPDRIIFKDVKVLEADERSPMLQASRVTVRLFDNTVVEDLVLNIPVLKDYWALHGKKIHAWAKTLPKRNIRILVPNGRLYLKNDNEEPVSFKLDLGLEQDHLNLNGSWGLQSSIDLWGSWQDNTLNWKGFMFDERFNILDIDGNMDIQDTAIILRKLSFSVNGNAVQAQGECSRQDLFQCDANITLKDTSLHFHAQNTPEGIVFKGAVGLQNTHADFEDLTARIINGSLLILRIKQTQAAFSVRGNEYTLPLENIRASINFSDPNRRTMALSAQMPSGWHIKAQGSFIGMLQDIKLFGILTLHNGHFDHTSLQVWAAKTLQMPSLNNVSDADLSCRFKIDRPSLGENGSITIADLKLDTEDFDLNGFFYLNADDLVSSQDSVRFSRKLLSESPIGRHIIGLVSGAWTLPFEFRLSGNMYRMNFQWDNSTLKDRVRQHLFSFFERMIDRRMDAHPYYNVTIPNESVSPG